MSEVTEDRERQVIPRWRSFSAAAQFGEVTALKPRAVDAFPADLLNDLIYDWQSQRSLSVAADLLSAAVTIGQTSNMSEVAEFILSVRDAPVPIRELAAKVSGGGESEIDRFSARYDTLIDNVNEQIHANRRRLGDFPDNPVLWANLALLYTTNGQSIKAQRAIRIAHNLAPTNRFILRSACRYYLHIGDSEQAHRIVAKSELVRHDPWILAAEVATSAVLKRTSRFIKSAFKAVEQEKYSMFHLSELSGALATIEAYEGNFKKARKLCQLSLIEPAENAVAQAAWLSRNVDSSLSSDFAPEASMSNEANAWISGMQGNWHDAFLYAQVWQQEQPFSSRPAMFGAGAASTGLEDFAAAETMLKHGLRSNRTDPTLINNLAFAQAKQNKVREARLTIALASDLYKNVVQNICVTATQGLIEFRAGNFKKGRSLYQYAILAAKLAKNEHLATIAQIYLAIEESIIASSFAVSALQESRELADKLHSPFRETFFEKIERAKAALLSRSF